MSETRKSSLGPAEIQLFVAKDFLDTVLVPRILRSDVTKRPIKPKPPKNHR